MTSKKLVGDLQRLIPADRTSDAPELLERHASDALGRYRAFRTQDQAEARPDVVVRPHTADEVAQVVAYAAARGVPLVPVGAGTGVMGGAIPVHGGIILGLARLDRIVEIDVEGRRATVGAGVVLEDLEDALGARGLLLGHDPWSRPIATVGGAISTNGMGYLAGRYGSMGQQVLGLEAVLGTGETVRTKAVPKTSGPDLARLFVGAEGTLGVITEATLEVFPKPECRGLRAYAFPGFEAGFHAVQEMYAVGLRPAMVDFAEEFPAAPDSAAETMLYLGFDGLEGEVAAQEARADLACRKAGGSREASEVADAFWERRHESAERYKRDVLQSPTGRRRGPWRMDYLHVAVPASRVLEYYRFSRALLAERGIPVREWSLWGRPEYFSMLIADPTPVEQGDLRVMADAVDDLLTAAQDLGGAMEYCHGVGLKLTHLMAREMGSAMEPFRRIKRAWDPKGILNAGKLGL